MTYLPSPLATRQLGKSGLIVSGVAWGMWRFAGDDVAAARAKVEAALEAGVTLFDTADIYGPGNGEPFGAAEALLGRVFAEAPALRSRMVLATKGGIAMGVPYDSSASALEAALDASLQRLGVDHVDLWQIHRPDILTHPEEVAGALDRMVTSGKARALGVSNYSAAQIAALSRFLKAPLASLQPEWSALTLDPLFDRIVDTALGNDMAILAWSPLAGGRLADPTDERARAVVTLMDAKAEEAGVSRTAAALSWLMAHPVRPVPIVGTQQPARIAEIPQAYIPRWTRAEWYAVLVAATGEPLP